jgi:hypothetical protein
LEAQILKDFRETENGKADRNDLVKNSAGNGKN